MCANTPCRPLLEGDALQMFPQPLARFVLAIQPGQDQGVLLQWWMNSCARLPPACCPSNCCVVRRRVPPKALSDSSKSLASNSDVDPLSANNCACLEA